MAILINGQKMKRFGSAKRINYIGLLQSVNLTILNQFYTKKIIFMV
jgi:hypothetical protein